MTEAGRGLPLSLTDYMRAIGHDVGAPIRHIRGFSALLDDEVGDSLDAESRLMLDRIQSSAELAEAMIYRLHDLAHLNNRLKIAPIPSLAAVVTAAQEQVAKPELALNVAGDAQANSDPRLVTRMIANFMRNTLAYADQPSMTITIEQDPQGATITLTDRGPGFAQKEWPKVLQPFSRLAGRPTLSAVGLGLTEAEHIAGLLDIQMSADAIPGERLSITLRLPCNPKVT